VLRVKLAKNSAEPIFARRVICGAHVYLTAILRAVL
jgi:hypothetical protein